ncbi:MAG: LLM class flavin-dependent oxidoreductase, partial [Acidimicrobiales bacterium]
DQVVEKFVHIREMIGTNAVMPGFSYGGMPYNQAEASMRLFADKVLPELHALEVEPLNVPGALAAA